VQNYKEASAVRIAEDASAVQNTVEAPSSKTCVNEQDVEFSRGHSLDDMNDTFGSICCLSFVLLVLSYSFSLSVEEMIGNADKNISDVLTSVQEYYASAGEGVCY
jgi:hypothetical protein